MNGEEPKIRTTILGCGTSTGVPVIGCDCHVCTSEDDRNRRSRSSLLISVGSSNILIDTSTDLRYQSLKNNIKNINAVLFTHSHADHVHGIDELRSFNFIQKEAIPCYGDQKTLARIKMICSYIFNGNYSGGIPRLSMNNISGAVEIAGLSFSPVEVMHGEAPILGYRFANAAYITDCSAIPPASMEKLNKLELLILGALRYKPHNNHFNIEEAIGVVEKLKPKRTIFTHMSHEVDFERLSSELPQGIEVAYDGMVVELRKDFG